MLLNRNKKKAVSSKRNSELEHTMSLLKESGLFNSKFYITEYSDLSVTETDALRHFCEIGLYQDYKPNREFDPVWYREYYADIKADGIHPIIHYILFGKKEGRLINEYEGLNEESNVTNVASNEQSNKTKDMSGIMDKTDYSGNGRVDYYDDLEIAGFRMNDFFNLDVDENDLDSALSYLSIKGFKNIFSGRAKFHKEFSAFTERAYLDYYPDIVEAIANKVFISGQEHFRKYGYMEIVKGIRPWPKTNEGQNVERLRYINYKRSIS